MTTINDNSTINSEYINDDANNIVRSLKGTSVLAKEDARLRTEIIDAIRLIAANYGYDEMTTPIIYDKGLLTCKFEEGAELIDEIYATSDRGGRDLGLRYDLTVPFARYVAENANALTYPFKRFEVGEVFRDGPVKSGRARQFTQCDVDVVGDTNPIITAYEQMSMMISVFDRLGLTDVKIKYSSRRLAEGMLRFIGVKKDNVPSVIRAMDKKDKLSEEQYAEELRCAGLGDNLKYFFDMWIDYEPAKLVENMCEIEYQEDLVCESMLGDEEAIREWQETDADDYNVREMFFDGIKEIDELARLIENDERMRERCVFDMSLVRGQDYYTGIMFEAFAPDFPSSLAGGGRYDSIIGSLANVAEDESYSASGASFGIVPIMYLMKKRFEESSSDTGAADNRRGTVIIACSPEDVPAALRLANQARANKLVEVDVTERGVSKKMKAANKTGYAYVIVYGERERESGKVTLKNMSNGTTIELGERVFIEANDDLMEILTEE